MNTICMRIKLVTNFDSQLGSASKTVQSKYSNIGIQSHKSLQIFSLQQSRE